MNIEDILATKGSDVVTILPTATVAKAVAELSERGIGALVVSANGIGITGIVSERDIVRELYGQGAALLSGTVGDLMTSSVHTCSITDTPEYVMTLMTNHRVRHIPVMHQGALRGLVSIGDVVKSRIDALEEDHRLLVEYIGAR